MTAEGNRLLHAQNEAQHQPTINLQIARAYLAATDPLIHPHLAVRHGRDGQGQTWGDQSRWLTRDAQKPFDHIRHLKLVETRAEHLWHVLTTGTVSTNIFLRRMHNFALDMNWLLAGLVPRRQWPKIQFRPAARHYKGRV